MVDMHIHTCNSDGEFSVKEIVDMLKNLKADLFSITDHDNINSCYEMSSIDLECTNYIRGVEFSSFLNQYNCHILGYNFNRFDLIEYECNMIRNRKIAKILEVIYHLNRIGIYISDEEKNSIFNKKGSFGRIDLCRILMSRGYGSRSEIYDKYLEIPLPNHRSAASHVIDILHSSGGISVLAHPKEIESDYGIDIYDIIDQFLDVGLDGIEVYNSIHSYYDVKRYLFLAKKYNLLVTGGSDFHGNIHPERFLGKTTGYGKVLSFGDVSCSKSFLH